MSQALAAALRDFFRPSMFGLVLWPLLGSLLLWVLIGLLFWHGLVAAVQVLISAPWLARLLGATLLHALSALGVTAILLILLPPLVQATALLITAFIAVPRMVRQVAAESYPQLERKRGGSALGNLWNALSATLVYVLLWLASLPLWLFVLPGAAVGVLINGWLNDRLFRYDALAEHASREEYAVMRARAGGRFYGLGLAAALIQLVPLLNLVSPVYSGLSFIHFGLAELARLRAGDVKA
ncbi:MAG TPA: EI24 domain-containing protein [Nevskia sp.]|nr:EI24 domain-containing protein [Nevskia sp.]